MCHSNLIYRFIKMKLEVPAYQSAGNHIVVIKRAILAEPRFLFRELLLSVFEKMQALVNLKYLCGMII